MSRLCESSVSGRSRRLRDALLDEPQGRLLDNTPTDSLWGT